jgi:hypothetical protein
MSTVSCSSQTLLLISDVHSAATLNFLGFFFGEWRKERPVPGGLTRDFERVLRTGADPLALFTFLLSSRF